MASVDTAFKLPLSLDYSGVLSAWEQIGGNVFDDNTEFSFQDPSAIELDLSDWEAQLKPSCKLEGASGDTLFSAPCNFFFPSELGIAPATNGAAGAAGAKDSQVVPQMPSGCLPSDSESAAAASDEAAAGATDLPMTVPLIKCESIFDDLDLDIPCCSPSLSCNSDAVVPDLGAANNLSSSHNSNVSSTATSGCTYGVVPQTPAGFVPTEALPQPVVAALPPQPAPVPLPRQPGLKPAAAPAQESIPAPAPTAAAGSSNGAATEVVTFVRTRAECLERYRQKKARRLYTKKIRYQLRKINADKRPRIKGRFVKKEELADYLAANKADVEAAITSGLGAAASDIEDEDAGMEYSDDE